MSNPTNYRFSYLSERVDMSDVQHVPLKYVCAFSVGSTSVTVRLLYGRATPRILGFLIIVKGLPCQMYNMLHQNTYVLSHHQINYVFYIATGECV